jgi:nucleoside-diphosphate-sugar epimerase
LLIEKKDHRLAPLPEKIKDLTELDELMSRPTPALAEALAQLEGDIMILGAGGKIGPTMARMAKRAIDQAGVNKKVFAVARSPLEALEEEGIVTLHCDLLDRNAVNALPRVKNIIYMAGRKFGSTGSEWLTWAGNVMIPHNVAEVFRESNFVVYSTGCVYPLVNVSTSGSVETDAPDPVGEYASSSLGRERIFDYYAAEKGTKVIHIRLNYALELRYGVLVDIATQVYNNVPVDVTTGYFNGIWQGDCCNQTLQCFSLACSPASILNITGSEILSVRQMAKTFGERFGKTPIIKGQENGQAYLSNAAKANSIFGPASVTIDQMIEWTVHWIQDGGENIGKPTHFETQNGKY